MEIKIDWPSRGHGLMTEEINTLNKFLLEDNSKSFTQGDNVTQFEKAFGDYIGSPNCAATMSAAHALDIIAMRIRSLTNRKKVLVPSHTYCASALGFLRAGFEIEFMDIGEETWTAEFENIKSQLTEEYACVVLVHLYGKVIENLDDIIELAHNLGVYCVEDCAQSLGGLDAEGVHCGIKSDYSCFSFHSQKNLTTLGEGGMIHVNSKNDLPIVRELRINGHRPFSRNEGDDYWTPAMVDTVETLEGIVPMKSTMSEAQAIIGRLVLGRLDKLMEKRRSLLASFAKKTENVEKIVMQKGCLSDTHGAHLLPLRIVGANRDEVIRRLYSEYGVKAIVQYYPLHCYDLFKKNKKVNSDVVLINTEDFFGSMISLPFSAVLNITDLEYMADALIRILKDE